MQKRTGLLTAILITGLIAGTLDGTAAIINFYAVGGTDPSKIFKYIASSLFGKSATTGDTGMVIFGVVLHYIIAFIWTVFFFLLFPKIRFTIKNKFVAGILYGMFVWAIMNLVVVPLSKINKFPTVFSKAMIQMGILIICIGLPISLLADRYYGRQTILPSS